MKIEEKELILKLLKVAQLCGLCYLIIMIIVLAFQSLLFRRTGYTEFAFPFMTFSARAIYIVLLIIFSHIIKNRINTPQRNMEIIGVVLLFIISAFVISLVRSVESIYISSHGDKALAAAIKVRNLWNICSPIQNAGFIVFFIANILSWSGKKFHWNDSFQPNADGQD